MEPFIFESVAESPLPPPPQKAALLRLFSPPPKSAPPYAKLYTPDRLLVFYNDSVQIVELGDLSCKVQFRTSRAVLGVAYCYNPAEIHYYEKLVTVHETGLELHLFDFKRQTYMSQHFLSGNPMLLARFTSDTCLHCATNASMYTLTVSESALTLLSKQPFPERLSSLAEVHGDGQSLVGIAGDQLQIYQLGEELVHLGGLSLNQLVEKAHSAERVGESLAVQLTRSVIIIRYLQEKYQIYNSFSLDSGHVLFDPRARLYVAQKEGRLELYRFKEEELTPMEIIPLQEEEGLPLQLVYEHAGILRALFL